MNNVFLSSFAISIMFPRKPSLIHEGMDREALKGIWAMVDDPIDNRLDSIEFAVAMHLIVCVTKKGLPTPLSLPPSLMNLVRYARANQQLQQQPSTISGGVGGVQPGMVQQSSSPAMGGGGQSVVGVGGGGMAPQRTPPRGSGGGGGTRKPRSAVAQGQRRSALRCRPGLRRGRS